VYQNRSDVMSGARDARPGLDEMPAYICPGDSVRRLIVWAATHSTS
jgi:hypothetical protein